MVLTSKWTDPFSRDDGGFESTCVGRKFSGTPVLRANLSNHETKSVPLTPNSRFARRGESCNRIGMRRPLVHTPPVFHHLGLSPRGLRRDLGDFSRITDT